MTPKRDSADEKRKASSKAAVCPICGKPPAAAFGPFCSKRCADVDLYRWLSGRYAIPGAPAGSTAPEPEDDD